MNPARFVLLSVILSYPVQDLLAADKIPPYDLWNAQVLSAIRDRTAFEGGICDLCKAKIRGEALHGQHEIKKEPDKSLHKEGLVIEKKTHG